MQTLLWLMRLGSYYTACHNSCCFTVGHQSITNKPFVQMHRITCHHRSSSLIQKVPLRMYSPLWNANQQPVE